MKLTCDSCNAKYSIADDRVAGKVFKIRCKKCSHVIIVRGEIPASVAEPAPPPATSGEWYAIVDGEQAGPFERDHLARFAADTFVWREGMDDWVTLASLDAPAPALPAPTPIDARTLRNERNETSVLFTLGNLAQLAAKPAPVAKATATASGPVEEGSGLIDIRALASSLAPTTATAKSASGSFGDLPLYAPTSIADPVVLVPAPSRGGFDRRVLVAFVAMLALIGALVTMLIVVLARDTGTAHATAVTEPSPAPTTIAVPVAVPVPQAAPPVIVAAPQPQAPAPPKQTRKTTPPPPKAARVDAPPKKTDDADCNEVSCTYNDFAGNCCDSWKQKAPKPAPQPAASDLPENLDRAALAAGIATIKAQRCGSGSSVRGDVHVSVKVTAEGKVSSVTIKSTPDPALGACVEREAKLGTFAKTKRGGSFAYFWRF